ncbi:MAG: nickel pincer cofactor biosynthesis protein LarB [Candidatus Helarchaeota archaeon]
MGSFREVLKRLKESKITIEEAEKKLKGLYIEEIDGLANLDINREFRTGFPEVIFAESKEVKDIIKICERAIKSKGEVLVSRLTKENFKIIKREIFEIFKDDLEIIYNEVARLANFKMKKVVPKKLDGKVGIITAGTSDIGIGEEVRMVIEAMGGSVLTAYDVGISGFHRIFPPLKKMLEADVDVIIVIAGMEGTLPSVVASLVDVPVIGVPAPTGYGLGEKGIGALTTMLQSCAPGLVVVNIGNGFGAAAAAILIIKRVHKFLNKGQG